MGLGEVRLTGSILTGVGSKPELLTILSTANDFADASTTRHEMASSTSFLFIESKLQLQ